MSEPFEVGDRVNILSGYDTGKTGQVVEVNTGDHYPIIISITSEETLTVPYKPHELERIEDDGQMGRQGTTDNPVPPSVARQPDDDQRGARATDQSPSETEYIAIPAVAAENKLATLIQDELATLIAEQIDLGMSVTFIPTMGWIEVSIDPYDDDDGDADGLAGFGPDPLAALRVALDLDW